MVMRGQRNCDEPSSAFIVFLREIHMSENGTRVRDGGRWSVVSNLLKDIDYVENYKECLRHDSVDYGKFYEYYSLLPAEPLRRAEGGDPGRRNAKGACVWGKQTNSPPQRSWKYNPFWYCATVSKYTPPTDWKSRRGEARVGHGDNRRQQQQQHPYKGRFCRKKRGITKTVE